MIHEALDLGVHFIKVDYSEDERGAFGRLWSLEEFASLGFASPPLQMSLSRSKRQGTLRGLHWQTKPHAESKFVHVLRGRIFDVVAKVEAGDLRFMARELTAGEGFLIPAGLAHGFLTLCDDVELLYMMDAPFVSGSARGARYDDPALSIHWPFEPEVISERDLSWPAL
jgi:dTDP-4-dehydrorhamnose 3,5-epimerase